MTEPYALADRVDKDYVSRAKTMKSLALTITITTLAAQLFGLDTTTANSVVEASQ